jgi:lipid-A-disaccharide synthase-like uncharacterized protein
MSSFAYAAGKTKNRMRAKSIASASNPAPTHPHQTHSPFFILWEMIGLACVVFLSLTFILGLFFHIEEKTHQLIELADIAAEIILIAEVLLIFFVARNKIHFIRTKWMTILSVIPIGNAFRVIRIFKLGWHDFEKTRVGRFIEHPIRSIKRWLKRKVALHTRE